MVYFVHYAIVVVVRKPVFLCSFRRYRFLLHKLFIAHNAHHQLLLAFCLVISEQFKNLKVRKAVRVSLKLQPCMVSFYFFVLLFFSKVNN